MASKSRLGKGLGALFPTLPGGGAGGGAARNDCGGFVYSGGHC